MTKIILILISILPLGLHSPYLLQAWSGSRLDHWDWLFYLISIPAAVWGLRKERPGKCDFYAFAVLIPMLILTLGDSLHHINALAVASSVGVIFSVVWLAWSWQSAYRLLPVALILLCGTPSSSYQLSLLLMCPVYLAWAAKFLLALFCLIWIWCNNHFEWQMSRGTFFFSSAVLLTGFVLLHSEELYFEGQSFMPEFSVHCGEFWGRGIQPDENTKRFFATGTVRQYRYTKGDTDISVLAVQCGRDIHEIHPASHCLRTSLWTVNSEKTVHLQDNFAVTEIDARKGAAHILVWVWYSSEKFSTPGFLNFRRRFRPDGNYRTYQISIPVNGDIEAKRDELHNFIRSLKKEVRHGSV